MNGGIQDKWFHGTAGRVEVEDLVKNARLNGSFAVRCSESVAGAFTISLLKDGRVYTYRVLPTPDGQLGVQTNDGVQKRKFSCIDDLVLEYRASGNGLVCGLTNPVPSPRRAYARQPAFAPMPTIQVPSLVSYAYPSAPPELPPRPPARNPQFQSLPAPPAPVTESPQQSCIVCMDAKVNSFLQPCGHVCVCMDCGKQLSDCPICRKKISKIQKAYLS